MKVGSLVEYIGGPLSLQDLLKLTKIGCRILEMPVKSKIYTVRALPDEIVPPFNPLVQLEEMIIGYNPQGLEMALGLELFREIIIPPDIQEEITESLTRELVEIHSFQV